MDKGISSIAKGAIMNEVLVKFIEHKNGEVILQKVVPIEMIPLPHEAFIIEGTKYQCSDIIKKFTKSGCHLRYMVTEFEGEQ